mgnify:CR=1 FL=1
MMSNARLKEQIEAAKIAFVHSAKVSSYADTPPTSSTVTQIPGIGTDHAQSCVDSATEMPRSPANAKTPIIGQDTIAQSDFEKLEARLQGLEDQIKNQQRDLHTLLQKLRGIAAKSQSAAQPKKRKGGKKLLVGVTLCVMGFGAVYYWLGAEEIISTLYQITGFLMALIDTLAGKI